ncbi:ribonuclease P protein subunit p29 [Zootermopsis nevadensis]|uniref:Ribonuclease P protein subunit p29 n=1 Tax=Zootermopsis nevadensis TaxID=136037 RepID=A0A067RRN4_ZOONE|nr:ribonuclease P protein subunit p29 [Zootermopsis nevadensis]KDR22434.1 Ribonuclease P protein subunit p29 [Zootermopsis nevadensis]
MSNEDLCSKLPKEIQQITGVKELQSDNEFIKEMVTASLPQSKHSTVDSELKRKFILLKFRTADKKNSQFKKKKLLSLKQRRELGLYKINRKGMKYKDFQELHHIWKEYMRSCLNLEELKKRGFTGEPGSKYWNHFSQLLLKADYHGAHLKVVRSTCSSLVGQSGIVVFDTKNTFKIIGTDNIVRTIPKQPSVFTMVLDDYTYTLHGKYFCIRPQDRSVKKIKTFMIADL